MSLSLSDLAKYLRTPGSPTGNQTVLAARKSKRRLTMESLESRMLMANDTFASAIALGNVTTTPSTSSLSITPSTDVDIYRFSVNAGQVVDFNINTPFNGLGGLGSYIRLFASSGTQLAFNNDAAAPGETLVGFDAYLRYNFSTAGTYYVGVSNSNNVAYNPITGTGDVTGGPNATGTYTLIVNTPDLTTPDPDDTFAKSNSLGTVSTTPVSVNAAIDPGTDVDMYRFLVTAGQVVDFNINTPVNGPGGLGSYIRLFASSGTQLAGNDDGNAPGENVVGFDAYLRYTFSTAGTYYLGVSNYTNITYNPTAGTGDVAGGLYSTGTYTLIVNALPVDPDSSFATAYALGSIGLTPSSVSANITPDIDIDMYRFSVTAGQVVDFNINTPLNGPGGLGSYIRLFASSGTQLAFNNDAAAPGETLVGFDAYLRYTFSTAGTYYLGVSNYTNVTYNPITGTSKLAGGFYSIGVYTLLVSTPDLTTPDLDDTFAKSNLLGTVSTTPVSVNAAIDPDTDVDMYRFSVSAGQVVDFNINTSVNGPGGLGSYLRLFASSGTQLAVNNDGNAPGENVVGFDAYLRYTFSTAGNYYLGVSNYTNIMYNPTAGSGDLAGGPYSTGTYTLIVNALPVDPDSTFATANALGTISAIPSSVSASISPDIDVDMYRFSVTAGQVVDFNINTPLNGPGGLASYIRLFTSAGSQLAINNGGNAPGENVVGFDAYLRYTFSTAGTYYLGISNYTNIAYNPSTGAGKVAGGFYSIGTYTLIVNALPADPDSTLLTSNVLGSISAAPTKVSASITPDIDVDMYQFSVTAGQVVGFNINTPLNGPGGLGSYLRLFNASGQQLAFNNDAAAPGETVVGFDAYLRYAFSAAGTYYIGVSNSTNIAYNAVSGSGDIAGGFYSIGVYTLIVQTAPSTMRIRADQPSGEGEHVKMATQFPFNQYPMSVERRRAKLSPLVVDDYFHGY